MEAEYILVFITAPSREAGEQVARTLLDARLAACVNIVPAIDSRYWWQGEVQSEQEVLLIVKSRRVLFEEGILPAVRAVHPYDVPEILAMPILMGSQPYLDWIGDETASSV